MPRVAIAQIRPAKGDSAANLARIGGVLAQIANLDPAVDLLITPEASTSGYFVEGGVRDVAVTAGTLLPELTPRHETAGGKRPIDVPGGVCPGGLERLFNTPLYWAPAAPGAARENRPRQGAL